MGVALVTGASSGLGADFAKLLAREGHTLVLVARREERLQNLSEALRADHPQLKVHVIAVDLGRPGAGQTLYEHIQRLGLTIDYLINNAGVGSSGEFQSLPLAHELKMIDLNVRTLVELTHLLLPAMIARRRGHILNVGSMAGFQPGPYMATYYATKAFVNSFSEALHEELQGTGVSCTVLAPGATATEFGQVAGIEESLLFRYFTQVTSQEVVQQGYRGMKNSRSLVVPGLLNRLMIQSLRFTPRIWVRKLVKRIHRS